eukprot:TRINITY_DN5651_c0_g1_i4.p1 TRINITY_DN5651_c0_g1~~TRINITY_DN5651_c0_g1_i4.p1  ORF type:complete len:4653 (+),score=840.28 TRINITY_DN5651_c0_g1_i4:145-14103(+)
MLTESAPFGMETQMILQQDITFVVTPPEIVFKQYEPFQTYEAPFSFKNQTKTAKSVKVLAPESRFFSLSEPRTTSSTLKVAAGLSVSYTVTFKPEEDADYECDLVVVTERERFKVQVRAYASRGKLDFPTQYTFPKTPVKFKAEKVFYIRNIGIKPAAWTIAVSEPWSVFPSSGTLQPDQGFQMSLFFQPMQCAHYKGELVVSYSNGDIQTVRLLGESQSTNVSLSANSLLLEPTFISLERQGIITLFNKSDVTIDFQWKAQPTLEDEEEEKDRLREQLRIKESVQRELLVTSMSSQSLKSDAGVSSTREVRALSKQCKAKWNELQKGSLVFEHDYFTIEPIRGTLLAHSQRDIIVTFNPQLATTCEVGAYLDVVGRSERLPITLKGQGIGPTCHFSYNALDLGDIFINSIHHYEVMLENTGSIHARFSLNAATSIFANKFKFKPSHGTVPPGQSQTIGIAFSSDIIGILNEAFYFHIQGSRDDLGLYFKGRVIGPTFHFDTDEIDFGNVSFNFLHRKVFSLVNTSEIPMQFRLRVPEDQGKEKEFTTAPQQGLVLPHGKQSITLDFLSNTVQEYNAHLVVDIDDVGENLHSVPIKASCTVPKLTVGQENLDFGRGGMCFVGYPYDMQLEIKNGTQLSSKYDMGFPPEDDPIRRKVDVKVDQKKGTVAANSTHLVTITLVAKLVGPVHLPIYLRVLGSDKRIPITLSAKITGPVVTIDNTLLDFGKITVLQEHCRRIELKNESPIPAVFNCKLQNKHFSLKNDETVIPPSSSYAFPVYAFLDDTSKFTDELTITVANSKDIQVGLTAIGSGTTLVPSISLEHDIDFGNVFTTTVSKKTFTMYNKGKRPLQISWNNDRSKPKEGEQPYTFVISPERATIVGKGEQEFCFDGCNDRVGRATERFVCKLTKTHKVVFRPTVVGTFVVPLLEPSEKSLAYSYIWDTANGGDLNQSKPLSLRNVSPMVLSFSLRAGSPFTIDKTEYSLQAGESCTVHIGLYAGYRGDKQSHKLKTKLVIAYKDHPQREFVDLSVDIVFPNIILSNASGQLAIPASLDFGCIMHETEKREYLTITNTSRVNTSYLWTFDDVVNVSSNSAAAPFSAGLTAFDILPIRGFLKPNESERVEVIYYSQSTKRASATASLIVDGGPDYTVNLEGEACNIHFRFDKTTLDFGLVSYERSCEKELVLHNSGKVSFTYTVDSSQFSPAGALEVSPPTGTVKGGDKAKLLVKLHPKMPKKVDDVFLIHVAHFEPHVIHVRGIGLYNSLSVSGPGVCRIKPPNYDNLLQEAKSILATDSRRYFLRMAGSTAPSTGGSPERGKPDARDIDRHSADIDEEIERLHVASILSSSTSQSETAADGSKRKKKDPTATTSVKVEGDVEVSSPVSRRPDGKPIISTFSVDFGTVVKGDIKRKHIKVTNTSSTQLSFTIDKRILQQSGISVTPDKVTKLAGHPTYAEQTLEIQLITKGDKAKDVSFGAYALTVPIEIRSGGIVNIEVKAFIMVPQLSVSHSPLDQPLDFHTETLLPDGTKKVSGTTVGETRVITLQLKNPLPLPCDWCVRSEVKRNQPRNQFICKPERGVLSSNQKSNLQVMFVPHEGGLTHGLLNIKIAQNPRTLQIPCVGTGEELSVEVSPPLLDLGSVMPYVTVEQPFQLKNTSKTAVEVYALAFDKLYLVEEEILRSVNIYNSDGVGYLPPREVGGSLDDELLEQCFSLLENTDDELRRAIAADSDPASPQVPQSNPVDANTATPVGESLPAPVKPAPDASKSIDGLSPFIIVFGPPYSGKTSISEALSRDYHCPVVSLDDLLLPCTESDTDDSCYIKDLLDPWPATANGPVASTASEDRLKTILHNKLNQYHQSGCIIDGICSRSIKPNDTPIMARALALATEMIQQQGQTVHLVVLDVDESCINLRVAEIDERRCITGLEQSRVPEVSEDAFDAMTSQARRDYERGLKRFRQCKKSAKQATAERERLQQVYEEGTNSTILELCQQEEEAKLAAEQEEASKKKPNAKKSAPAQEPEPVVEEDLTPIQQFVKQYSQISKAFGTASQIVTCLNDNSKDIEAVVENLLFENLPKPQVVSTQESDDDLCLIRAPHTKLRVEKPKAPREVRPCPWFSIVTDPMYGIPSSLTPTEESAPAGKGKGGQPQQTVSDDVQAAIQANKTRSRWILQPDESIKLTLLFQSTKALGENFEELIQFGIVDSKQTVTLKCTATSQYPDIVRDPKQIFSSRKSVKKHAFDFGPLLVRAPEGTTGAAKAPPGKRNSLPGSAKNREECPVPCEQLKIQNHSFFDAEVTWMFAAGDQKTYQVHPTVTKLPKGGSEVIRVTATPESVGTHDAQLVGLIKDNPKPIILNMTSVGCSPEVQLTGEGIEDAPDGGGKQIDFSKLLLEEVSTRTLTLSNTTSVPLRWEIIDSPDVTKKIRPEFKFECLTQSGTAYHGSSTNLLSANASEPVGDAQPAKGSKKQPEPDKSDTALICKGRLEQAGHKDTENIKITFLAPKADVLRCDLTLQIRDDVEGRISQSIPLRLLAEAYDVYLESTEEISFGKNGLVKVGMPHRQQVKLQNRGKYPFMFDVYLKKKYAAVFTIEPHCGILRPKDPPTVVDVTFESKNEIVFKDSTKAEFDINIFKCTDEQLQVTEADANQPVTIGDAQPIGSKPLLVEVEARNLRFQVVPSHGLNFGPCLCNDKKRMPLDILNNGPFELRFKIYDMSQGPPEVSSTPDPADKKSKKPAKPAAASPTGNTGGELELGGAFVVFPCEGVVAPGDSREITVQLDPKAAASQQFTEKLGISIEDCNPAENPEPLLLEGESCAPGINADLDSPESETIFEEQQIVSRLDSGAIRGTVYSRDDKVFSFGPIITRQSVSESLRISNPFTVPCTVNIAIKQRGDSDLASQSMSAFSVAWSPTPGALPSDDMSVAIPPHEHRYVKITFSPTELRPYFAQFEATVKDGTDPKTRELTFEIRGEGSLPQLHVELQPPPPPRVVIENTPVDPKGKGKAPPAAAKGAAVDAAVPKALGTVLMFYRTLVGMKSCRHITISNVGDLPASFKFTMPVRNRSSAFAFPARNDNHELQPGGTASFPVYFEPQTPEQHETKITMSVYNNPFEDTIITLSGDGYSEDLLFENLNEGCDNYVTLPDCGVEETTTRNFTVSNHCNDVIRYMWAMPEDYPNKFTVSPSTGHLHPGDTKNLVLRFVSSEPADLDKVRLMLQYWKITPTSKQKIAWDTTMTSITWVQDITPVATPSLGDEGTADEQAADQVSEELNPSDALAADEKTLERRRRPFKKVVEVTPEPEYTYNDMVAGSETPPPPVLKDLFVKVICDYAQCELLPDAEGNLYSETGINFATTKMLQTRTVSLSVKNIGKAIMECNWSIAAANQLETDDTTFRIEPTRCKIPAGDTQLCRIMYSPLDTEVHKAVLVANIPNQKSDSTQLQVNLSGTAECPLMHIDLPDSDYLTSGGRNPELPTPAGATRHLDDATRVIEFDCSGVKVRSTKRFNILNPTTMSYEYLWTNITDSQHVNKQFTCSSLKGVIHSGKQAEMQFDFFSEDLKLRESFWMLTIGKPGQFFTPVNVPFLLVGRTSEPNVFLTPTRVNYDQVLLGAKSKKTITLVNQESIPFSYLFHVPRGNVTLQPMSGTVPANTTIPVEICFTPTAEEPYNCNVSCNIRKKNNSLTCNIKGEGYSIHESLVVKHSDGSTQLLAPTGLNVIDFGKVHINGKNTKQIVVSNSGKLHFDYKWFRPPSSIISLTSEIDTVGRSGKSVCDLIFAPFKVSNVESYKMVCKITNGASYTVIVQGSGVQPNINFSTTKIDLGAQFVYIPGTVCIPKQATLLISNNDVSDISFDCTAECPPWLEHDATSTVLAKAGTKENGVYIDKKEVTFTFKPTDIGKVETTLPFNINGMYNVNVHLSGEGTTPKVELTPGQSTSINLGSVRAGEVKHGSVRIQCKSKIPTPFSLVDSIPAELARQNLVQIQPSDEIILKPREVRSVDFTFKPPLGTRLVPFNYSIKALIAGQRRHFINLMGSSIGMEVYLDQKTLSFGTVVQGTRQTRKVLIMNTGDVPVTFQWPELGDGGFSVSQSSGHMLPHSEQACEVVFAPTAPTPESHRNISIKIVDATVQPHITKQLPLSLVGVCSKRPAVAEEYSFKCSVRDTQKKTIKLTNTSTEDWSLSPALDSNNWSVTDKLHLPANQSVDVEVTYNPILMTKTRGDQTDFDKGTLFFPLPTGDPRQMMFSLIGEAAPPAAEDDIEETITAKTPKALLLPVKNWLNQSQKFTVVRDFMVIPATGTPVPIDASIAVSGSNTIDVPPHASRNYKLTFNCFRECRVRGTCRFVDEATKEYLFFNITFNVKPPKDLKIVTLKTPARQQLSEDIYVESPLDCQVSLDVTSSGHTGEVTHPDKLVIAPKSASRISVEYLPLVAGPEKQARLVLKSPELGEFPYALNLTALPPVPEKALRFSSPLGSSQQLTVRLKNLAKTACDYTCKFLNPKTSFFKSQGAMVVKAAASTKPDGEEFSFDVTFEPNKLGEAKDTLEVSSPVGGTYVIALHGLCTAPQRQGPVECKHMQPRNIVFRNVFNDVVTYSFTTDSPSFTVAKATEVIPAKKEVNVSLTYKNVPEDGPFPKAKLSITCQLDTSSVPVTWVYYLSGKVDDGATGKK